MAELKRVVRRLLPDIARALPAVLLMVFWLNLPPNASKMLQLVPSYVWLGGLSLGLVYTAAWNAFLGPQREERFLGDMAKQPFKLEPGETRVFSSFYSVGGLLYLRAGDYIPRARIRYVASQKKRLLGDPGLRLWLTDRRLMLQSRLGNTWRIIPTPNIEWVRESPRRFFFSPDRVVIGYHHEGHSEVLVFEDKSVMGRTLKEALLAVNLPSGERSSPSLSNPPNKIGGF